MKICVCLLLSLAAASVIPGCSGVKVIDAPGGEDIKGVPVYMPEPYLLATSEPITDKNGAPVGVKWSYQVVHLRSNKVAYYLKPTGSLGSASATIKLNSNGVLAELGASSDQQIDEFITALGSSAASLAGVAAAADGGPAFILYKIDFSGAQPKLVEITE